MVVGLWTAREAHACSDYAAYINASPEICSYVDILLSCSFQATQPLTRAGIAVQVLDRDEELRGLLL